MKKISLVLFIVSSLGEMIAGLIASGPIHIVCKLLIMISLGMYYLFTVGARSTVVMLAIFFSFVGDALLLRQELFIGGLGSFLAAHIMYILAYWQHINPESDHALSRIHQARMAFPVILAGSGLVVILYPSLGDLKIPVIIYACVIVVMVISALQRSGRTSRKSFWFVFGGAVLFMISDSILAIDKFLEPIVFGSFWIMLTYCAAQFLIIEGLIVHTKTEV